MSDSRAALLIVLASALVVTSCATWIHHRSAPATVVEAVAVPLGDPLLEHRLLIPVQGVTRAQLRDNFHERRGKRFHGALDIMAKRGTPVIAAGDGRIAKVYRHGLGGLCVYQYDAAGQYVYYYAHLDRFAEGLTEGLRVRRGDPIGYVGSTGNASPTAPHLHFALIRLDESAKWYKGVPVNPYPYLVEPGR